MNINHYRRAMDRIAPDAELKERIMKQTEQNHARLPAGSWPERWPPS